MSQSEEIELAAFCLRQNIEAGSASICVRLVCRNGRAHVVVTADIRIRFCIRIGAAGKRLRKCISVSFQQHGAIEIGGVACDELCILPGETKEVMLQASLGDLLDLDFESYESELVLVEEAGVHVVEHVVAIEDAR